MDSALPYIATSQKYDKYFNCKLIQHYWTVAIVEYCFIFLFETTLWNLTLELALSFYLYKYVKVSGPNSKHFYLVLFLNG